MSKPKILVILGSTRQGRFSDKIGNWFMKATDGQELAELELVDLKDYPMPMFDDAVPPVMRTGNHDNPDVQKWLDKIESANGYIVITPEYNRSVPSVLKNALDFPYKEWANKPMGIVSYGGANTAGAYVSAHLATIAMALQMHPISGQVNIPSIFGAFDESGNMKDDGAMVEGAKKLLEKVSNLASKLQ